MEVLINRPLRPRANTDRTRINHEIRIPRVRVIGADGEALGILTVGDALQKAEEAGLDLIEIAPNADPPVCRIIDYGKFKYEKSKKAKEAKKKQHIMHLKEIKLHPKTDEHDYLFKIDHARKFLLKGDRVKITLVFRGREIMHLDFGKKILERAEAELLEVATMEQSSKREGRNMISTFIPDKAKTKEYIRKMELERKRTGVVEQQPAEPVSDSTEE